MMAYGAADQNVPIKGRYLSYGNGAKIYQVDQQGQAQSVAPGATLAVSSRLFAGAKVSELLDHYESSLGIKKFNLLIDWGWFYFITRPMFKLIDFFYRLIGNFGLAILCVTLLVKIVFLPLANRSYMSMARMKAMHENLRLPGVRLEDGIALTSDIAQAARVDAVLLAVPAQSLRDAAMSLAPHLTKPTPVVAHSDLIRPRRSSL